MNTCVPIPLGSNTSEIDLSINFVDRRISLGSANWLSAAEQNECTRYGHPSTLQNYLAGRLVAKRLIHKQGYHDALRDIEILSRDEQGNRTEPRLRVRGRPAALPISISHTDFAAAAAVSSLPHCRIGIDLVRIEPRPRSFASTWFSAAERSHLQLGDSYELSAAWACKEAAFKATGRAESFAPRLFEITRKSRHGTFVQTPAGTVDVATGRWGDHVIAVATANEIDCPRFARRGNHVR